MGITVEKAFGKKVLIECIIFFGIIAMFALFVMSVSDVKNDAARQVGHNNAVFVETEADKPEMVMAPNFRGDIAKMRAGLKESQKA